MSVPDSRTGSLRDAEPESWLLVGVAPCVLVLELASWLSPTEWLVEVRVALGPVTLTVAPTFALVGRARGSVWLPTALLATVAGPVYGYTGFVLPWDRTAFAIGQASIELPSSVPVVGGSLAGVLFGGYALSQRTLELFAAYHVAAGVGLVLAGALALVVSAFADRA